MTSKLNLHLLNGIIAAPFVYIGYVYVRAHTLKPTEQFSKMHSFSTTYKNTTTTDQINLSLSLMHKHLKSVIFSTERYYEKLVKRSSTKINNIINVDSQKQLNENNVIIEHQYKTPRQNGIFKNINNYFGSQNIKISRHLLKNVDQEVETSKMMIDDLVIQCGKVAQKSSTIKIKNYQSQFLQCMRKTKKNANQIKKDLKFIKILLQQTQKNQKEENPDINIIFKITNWINQKYKTTIQWTRILFYDQ